MNREKERLAPVVLFEDGEFCIYLVEKNIAGVGHSLEEAYAKYQEALSQCDIQEKKYGLAVYAQESFPHRDNRSIIKELGVYLLKVATGVGIAIIVFVSLMPAMRAAFDHQTNKIIPDKYFSERYWAFDVPRELNQKYDLLTTAEQIEMAKEWERLLSRLSIIGRDKSPEFDEQ